MKFTLKKIAILLFMLMNVNHSLAQIKSWNHTNYTTADGLPSNSIINLAQDKNGFIWIATPSGLCRFDGDEFVNIFHSNTDTNSIPSDFLNGIKKLPNDTMLISTSDGLYVMNTETFKGYTIRLKTQIGFESLDNNFKNIEINTSLKKVIVLTSTAFVYFDYNLSNMEVIRYPFDNRDIKNITNYSPLFLENGDVLFYNTIKDEYYYVDYKQKRIRPFIDVKNNPYAALSKYDYIDCSAMDSLGNLWFHQMHNDTLFCCQPYKSLIAYPLKNELQNVGWVCNISFPTRDKMFWQFNLNNKWELCELPYKYLLQHPGSDLTISNRAGFSALLYTPFCDKDSNLWVAYCEGIALVKSDNKTLQTIDLNNRYRIHEHWQYATDIVAINTDNLLIAAAAEQLYHYNIRNNTCQAIYHPLSEKLAYDNSLNTILPISKNSYLLRGMTDYTLTDSTLKKDFKPLNVFESIMHKNTTNAKFIDSKGNTWQSLKNVGVLKTNYGSNEFEILDRTSLINGNLIKCFNEDAHGNIWMANFHNSTLVKYDALTKKIEHITIDATPTNKYKWITAIAIGNNDDIFLAYANGLLVYNQKTKTKKLMSMADGLPSNRIEGLFYYKSFLFISTISGCMVLNTLDFSFKILNERDGIVDNIVTGAFYFDRTNDVLYLGGKAKVYKLNLEQLLQTKIKPHIVIGQLLINNIPTLFGEKIPQFSYTQNNISFRVSSIDYQSGSNKKYFYRILLNGRKGEWINNKSKQFNFINLSPGDYNIEVKSKNADNEWSDNIESLKFKINKPWYTTLWFYTVIALVLGFSIYKLFQFRLKQLQHVEKIRSRISRDLHDDIGSTLSSINIISNMMQRNELLQHPDASVEKLKSSIEKINERSQRLLDNMSDIVWSVKPENDSIEEIISRMREYATSVFESKEINSIIDFPNQKISTRLSLDIKNNFYLIFKEAVNNLAKYSQCKNAYISLKLEHKKLILIIKDDGVGFTLANSPLLGKVTIAIGRGEARVGNGLRNMQSRADEIKATIKIESEINKGTTITLQLTL